MTPSASEDMRTHSALVKFKVKRGENGEITQEKVRMAIRGDMVKPGIEYNTAQTSSQTPSNTASFLPSVPLVA
jgi:hypothetical protein